MCRGVAVLGRRSKVERDGALEANMCTLLEQDSLLSLPMATGARGAGCRERVDPGVERCLAAVAELLGASGAALLFADDRPPVRWGDMAALAARLLCHCIPVADPAGPSRLQDVTVLAPSAGPCVVLARPAFGPDLSRLRTVVLRVDGRVLAWLLLNGLGADDARASRRLAAAGAATLQAIAQVERIGALQQQTAELRRAKDDARAGDRAKSLLVSKIGHELKTPLNAITGMAQVLRMKLDAAGRGDPALGGLLEHITCAGRYMADVIDTLLKLGPLAMGRLAVGNDPIDLHAPLNEAVRIVEDEARRRGITIAVEGTAPALVRADRCALRQVLVNLLSNAVKYNVDQGQVWVTIQPGPAAQVRIRDSGPGLSEAQCARLFQPFDRLGAEKSAVTGHGLGLLICKELLEAMGGSIAVERPRDGGCEFRVSLRPETPPAFL
jgi:signal transduction histidine kinase